MVEFPYRGEVGAGIEKRRTKVPERQFRTTRVRFYGRLCDRTRVGFGIGRTAKGAT